MSPRKPGGAAASPMRRPLVHGPKDVCRADRYAASRRTFYMPLSNWAGLVGSTLGAVGREGS